jgi:predicted dehydrogenase
MAEPIAPERPVRWGILGAGAAAATVGADIAAVAGNELAAIGARDAGRAAQFAARLGVARSYGSYAELVADPAVDIVYVATTHAQHHEHALLALRAGKPVLVEKAFALNARQAGEIVAAARRRALFCMEGMWMRFNPLIRDAQRIAASGAIGTVRSVRAELSRKFPFDASHRLYDLAAGGGALLDLGVYPATFAWLFLGAPLRVQAIGALSPTGSDATAAMQWAYADGGFAQLSCTAELRTDAPALIAGTGGTIEVHSSIHRPTKLVVTGAEAEVLVSPATEGNGYRTEIAEVERCLRAGEIESPTAPLEQTVAILGVLDEARAQLGVRYSADEEA